MMDKMVPPALECRNIGRTFMIKRGMFAAKQPLTAVQEINLKINRGDVLAIVGESGCGKTTLAKMLLGLLPPTTGEILLDGETIHSVSIKEIATKVQPVFQDPYSSLNPRKTIEQIISLPLIVHKIGTQEERRERVEKYMRLVGLPKRLVHSYPNQLSGGQRQRVAIARALIIEPKIIVCDEPTSALDRTVQRQVVELLRSLQAKYNLTYLFISHDLAVVRALSHQVMVVKQGKVVEQGPAERVFAAPQDIYTQQLLEAAFMVPAG